MFQTIQSIIQQVDFSTISEERRSILQPLIDYIQSKIDQNKSIQLNFICTHNSRRSQFAQVWAKVAAERYGIFIQSFSAGVEVTACNPRTIASLNRFGFKTNSSSEDNPIHWLSFTDKEEKLQLFSKTLEHPDNPKSNFAAIMTCDHADETCPIVPGCEARIPVRYMDPKKYDDTPLESTMYDYRSFEIASEMFYVFSKIKLTHV
jgi:arsenate reductase (thioredoxin)